MVTRLDKSVQISSISVICGEVFQQLLHSSFNLVPNRSHLVHVFSLWVLKRPIISAQAWNKRTLIAAAHRDEKTRLLRQLAREFLRLGRAQINAHSLHGFHYLRMNSISRTRSGRDGMRLRRVGVFVKEGRGHLRSSGVVNAGENNLKNAAPPPLLSGGAPESPPPAPEVQEQASETALWR